jgi:putative membrane protein
MFEKGFLGTDAPLYMDVATLYFSLLPLLLAGAIFLAVKKRLKAHAYLQLSLFVLTMVVVLFFEIGIRVDGGYWADLTNTSFGKEKMTIYMVVHILIALVSILAWGYQVIRSFKAFWSHQPIFSNHKNVGRFVFAGMSITALMGVGVYWLLFVQAVS